MRYPLAIYRICCKTVPRAKIGSHINGLQNCTEGFLKKALSVAKLYRLGCKIRVGFKLGGEGVGLPSERLVTSGASKPPDYMRNGVSDI